MSLRKRIVRLFITTLVVSLTFLCFLMLRSSGISYQNRYPQLVNMFENGHRQDWIIVLTVNDGYFDFFRNWYRAYQHLDISYPLVIEAEDDVVFEKLDVLKSRTVLITRGDRESVKKAADYGTTAFSEIVSGRPTHILKYLKTGLNVLYSDIDMVWIENPFPYFTGDFDMWMELDAVNNYCTGLMAIKSNSNSIKLMKDWERSLTEKIEIDQKAFNKVVKHATIRISVLDSSIFPNGLQYFDHFTKEQRRSVVVVHNNWIIGHDAKLQRFKKDRLWLIPSKSDYSTEKFRNVISIILCVICLALILEIKTYYYSLNVKVEVIKLRL